MDAKCHRRAGASGQATVEHVGMVVVVALLLAAAGAWLASHVQPDRPPPPVIPHVWSGLDQIAEPSPRLPDLGLTPRDRRTPAIGRAFRRVVRTVRTGGEIVVVGVTAFTSGFGHGMWGAFTEFVSDPVALLTDGRGLIAALAEDPLGFTTAQFDAAVDYARELRAMSPKAAYRTFMRDLGEATADAVITRGKQLAKRAMLRALKQRIDARRVPTPDTETNKRVGD